MSSSPINPLSCLMCSKSFPAIENRASHCKNTGHTTVAFICISCGIHFASSVALAAHTQASTHISMTQNPALHLDGRDNNVEDSTSSASREAVMNSAAHLDGYDEDPTPAAVNVTSPDVDVLYVPAGYTAYCQSCDLWTSTPGALDDHLRNKKKHNWCFECSKDFRHRRALINHKNSITHQKRDQICPFCDDKFKSASGVANHIESGCHKITRHQVSAAIHAMNIVPNITIKQITAGPPPDVDTSTTLIATEDSFNGSAYMCSIPDCSKPISTSLRALNLHLNSPAHDDDVFKCPKCKTQFKVISGFMQHLESRTCGLAKMTQIEGYFNDLTDQFSRLLKI